MAIITGSVVVQLEDRVIEQVFGDCKNSALKIRLASLMLDNLINRYWYAENFDPDWSDAVLTEEKIAIACELEEIKRLHD